MGLRNTQRINSKRMNLQNPARSVWMLAFIHNILFFHAELPRNLLSNNIPISNMTLKPLYRLTQWQFCWTLLPEQDFAIWQSKYTTFWVSENVLSSCTLRTIKIWVGKFSQMPSHSFYHYLLFHHSILHIDFLYFIGVKIYSS